MITLASAIIALLGSATTVPPADTMVEPDPKAMSQSEIRAFNAKLAKGHPHFIRCKRSAATGSLVAREFSCRTNAQWAAADNRGAQEARDVMEEMTSKSMNTSN